MVLATTFQKNFHTYYKKQRNNAEENNCERIVCANYRHRCPIRFSFSELLIIIYIKRQFPYLPQ
jgi:hypothetical protein